MNELKVLCEPLMAMHLVLSDENAFIKKGVNLIPQANEEIFKSFSQANFIFDKIVSQPFYIPNLKELLGCNFFELFESTFNKLEKSEWVDFGVEAYIPKEKKEHIDKLISFVQDYKNITREVSSKRGKSDLGIPPPYEMMIYSKLLEIPLFSTNEKLDISNLQSNFATETEDKRLQTLTTILDIELPNLKIKNLDELLDVRNTQGAIEFRRAFNTFYSTFIQVEEPNLTTIYKEWNYFKTEALDLLVQEFKNDIKNWETMKIGSSIALNIAGFIPGISLVTGSIATLKDSKELVNQIAKQKRAKEFSWLCFITETRNKFQK